MYVFNFLAASTLATPIFASLLDNALFVRQSNNSEESYLSSVCFPNTTNPIPPCQEIINIQTACEPNGTSSLYLEAHAQCMCGGSFFSDWIGCLNCDYVHGGRSEQEVDTFNSILTSASQQLCTGTPTASFAAIFSSLTDAGIQGTGATAMSDQAPSNTAISLYFTASGSQGVGAITGSATAATATITGQVTSEGGDTSLARTLTTDTSTSKAGAATGSSVSSSSSTSTSTSKSGAAPTGAVVGFMGIVAGGIVIAAI